MKKKECVVHIGMHKTGSSSIQESLYQHLKSKIHHYFNLNNPNHSERIVSLFSKEKTHYAHRRRGFSKDDINSFNIRTRDMFLHNINTHNQPIMIISAEEIPFLLKSDLENLRDFLYQYFEKVTIVGYVRTMQSFIQSIYQQSVKSGNNNFDLDKRNPKYRKKFEKFDLVFGCENVKLWKFDPKSFPEGNVVLDFCNRLGIMITPEQTLRVNETLSREALSLLYIYRKYGPGYGIGANVMWENSNIVNALKGIGNTKIKFSPSLIQPIIEKNRDDILWMEDRLGETITENMESSINDIESEEDLLTVSEESFQKLCDMVGDKYIVNNTNINRAEKVADLVHSLRMQLAQKSRKGNDEIKLIELVQKVQKENTEQLGKMNEKRLAMIIRKTLEQIKSEIDNTDDGKIYIPVLGNFVVRMMEKEEEGKKVMHKRIVFKPAKEKKEEGEK